MLCRTADILHYNRVSDISQNENAIFEIEYNYTKSDHYTNIGSLY